jgi:hypothetical protein
MNEYVVRDMYQQWQQGCDDYANSWVVFVELAAKEFRENEDEVIRQLQKYSWFSWPGH